MILTAIVITMGIAAFVLALTYRSYRLTTAEDVANDPEDTRVSQLAEDEATAADEDARDPTRTRHRRTRRAGRAARPARDRDDAATSARCSPRCRC